jgi:hypothetical protein
MRKGTGLLGMLLSAIIIAMLWAQYAGLLYTPTDDERRRNDERARTIKEEAYKELFHTAAREVTLASNMYEAAKGVRPKKLDDLVAYGIDPRRKDPWGGKFVLDKDTLKCTGNRWITKKILDPKQK